MSSVRAREEAIYSVSPPQALAEAELATAAAAVAYAQVSECEEEVRAKVRPDMVIEGRRGG